MVFYSFSLGLPTRKGALEPKVEMPSISTAQGIIDANARRSAQRKMQRSTMSEDTNAVLCDEEMVPPTSKYQTP